MTVSVETSSGTVKAAGARDGARPNTVPALLLAIACGVIAANIYYLQPLGVSVVQSMGLSESASGLFASMTQIGYGVGLVLIVPLADLVENRRLVGAVCSLSVAALVVAALAPKAAFLLPATFAIGLGSVGVQLIVVYAAYLAPENERGSAIGTVTSGLMLGIMLSRPTASAFAGVSSWRAVLGAAALLTGGIGLYLHRVLPQRQMQTSETYRSLVMSLPELFRENRVVRWRTIIHCNLFFGFGLFWTSVPLVLRDRFEFTQNGTALFALTGIASVLAAPVAGRVADRGYAASGTICSILLVGAAFAMAIVALDVSGAIWLLCGASLLVGSGVTGHAVFGQRDIFGMPASIRARLNGLFMAAYFAAGALGSAVAGATYAHWGWQGTCALGLLASAMAALSAFLPGHSPADPIDAAR